MNKTYMGCLILLSLSVTQAAVARSWQDIKQSAELRVGVPGDYAPLAFHDKQGELVGFDIDMARSLANEQQLNVRFVLSSWPTLSADLAADKFDIAMGGITETPARKSQFGLSAPVVKNGKIAMTQCVKTRQFESLEAIDREGVRVTVNPGGTNQEYVDKHIRQAQIVRAQDNIASLQGIRSASADVMFTDLIEGDYYQSQEPGVFCVSTPNILPGTASDKVYMMDKDNRYLLEVVNTLLSGESKSRLARQWKMSE